MELELDIKRRRGESRIDIVVSHIAVRKECVI
jgi:hypothetical protein